MKILSWKTRPIPKNTQDSELDALTATATAMSFAVGRHTPKQKKLDFVILLSKKEEDGWVTGWQRA